MPDHHEIEQPTNRGLRIGGLRLRPRGIAALAVLVVLLLLGGSAVVMNASDEPVPFVAVDDEEEAAPVAGGEAEGSVTAFSNPEQFLGEDLRLTAAVSYVFTANSFRMIDKAGDDLLVIHSVGTVKVDHLAFVTGVIVPFEKAEVEDQLGTKLPPIVYSPDIEDEYVVVATSVQDLGLAKEHIKLAKTGVTKKGAPTTDPPATAASTVASTPVTSAPAPTTTPTTSSGHTTASSDPSGSGGGDGSSNGSGGGSGNGGSGGGGGSEEEAFAAGYAGDELAQYSDEATFRATLKRDDGTRIKDAKVTFELKAGGSTVADFSDRTNGSGVAKITETLSNSPGSYRLVVRYKDKNVTKERETFTIERDESALDLTQEDEQDSDEENEEGEGNGNGNDPGTLVATLTDLDDGTALGGRTVNFYADGEFMGSATTDDTGTARFEVPDGYKDKQTEFSAVFDGDDFYLTAGAGE